MKPESSSQQVRRYRVELFISFDHPQTRFVSLYAYDLNDAWIAAKRMESRDADGDYTVVSGVEPLPLERLDEARGFMNDSLAVEPSKP